MTFSMTSALQKFKERYCERLPQIPCDDDTEVTLVRINEQHGIRVLEPSPARDVQFGMPPTARQDLSPHRYLWVIDSRGIPYIIEQPLPELRGSKPKHTNLTGGKTAYMGGELWFKNSSSLFVSGGSGRYPPVSLGQLIDAVRIFESYKYQVTSLGWDYQYDTAARIYDDR